MKQTLFLCYYIIDNTVLPVYHLFYKNTRMPFPFGLGKTKRYEVSSKNSYIVCVHLLDSVLIECTLNAESTGQECLENISTRIGLNEVQYFGLRFFNKKPPELRWVNLDKPLKKQLEKHAQSSLLYFGVMFCIGDVLQIKDEMSRYQYYLHLKTEILDGRLQCSPEQAIVLAAYSVQAEMGDSTGNSEIHGIDYLNNMALLPQNMSSEDHIVKQLTREIASMHQQLTGVSPAAAKLQYIIEAQELEGYGLEYYPVKDTNGKELLLGTSFVGIFVKPLTGNQPTVYFKWSDIVNFTHNKRQLGIDTKLSDKPFFFLLDNTECTKYVYQMCCRQQKFYKSNSHLQAMHSNEERENEEISLQQVEDTNIRNIPDLQQDVLSSSVTDADAATTALNEYLQSVNESTHTVIINESSSSNKEPLQSSLHQLHFVGTELPSGTSFQGAGIPQSTAQALQMQNSYVQEIGPHGSNMPVTDVYSHDLPVGIPSGYSVQNVRPDCIVQPVNITRLPSYRPPPDYKTIMCQKMDRLAQQVQQQGTIGNVSHFSPDVLTYGQPDNHQMPMQYVAYYNGGNGYTERPFYDVVDRQSAAGYHSARPVDRASSLIVYPSGLRHDGQPFYSHINRISVAEHPMLYEVNSSVGNFHPARPVDRSSSLLVYPSMAHREGVVFGHVENIPDVAAMLQYRLPPPYPRQQSTSTPDLAMQMTNAISHSTPDLASLRGRPHLVVQSRFDQSVENLAVDNSQLQFLQYHPNKNNLDLPSSQRADFNRFRGMENESRSTGRIEVNRLVGLEEVGQGINQFEVDQATQLPYPDVTRNSTGRSPGTGQKLPFPVDLSRMVMLQRLEKQNQAYFQSLAANPATTNEEYIEQLRLQEIFRNIRLNSATPVDSTSMQPLPTAHLLAAGRSEFNEDAGHSKSNGTENQGSVANNFDGHYALSKGLRESKEKEVEAKTSVATKLSTPVELSARSVPPNSHVPHLAENLVSSKSQAATETEADLKRARNETQAPETKLEDSQVFAEFEQVPKKRLKKFDCSTAMHDGNRARNRFRDVVPYEDNRVCLKPTKENPSGYINASHVRVEVGKERFWYIATQGPLENTMGDFWQMVWENDVRVISMLTGLNDPEQRKCIKYWPNQPGTEHAVKCGDFLIALRYVTECWSYVTSGLIVRHGPSQTERLVWHLQYIDWPDRGCPNNHAGFLEYLDELSAIRRQVSTEQTKNSNPTCVVVHCSAGVGRTGVLILTEMMRTTVEHNGKIDVPAALKTLREQRMHMVQTVSQYSFVYQIIGLYLQSSRLI